MVDVERRIRRRCAFDWTGGHGYLHPGGAGCQSAPADSRAGNRCSMQALAGKGLMNGDRRSVAGDYALAAARVARTLEAFGRLGVSWGARRGPLTPTRLRRAFERLGATYVKVGQFIASSPSMFPHEFVTAFQGCLDQTPPLPFSVVEGVLREELGRDPMDCFASVEPSPLASASIAQVHTARLHSGEEVVLKIQKPGVDVKLRTDVKVLQAVLQLVESFYPAIRRTEARAVAADMERTFEEECDFLIESRRMRTYREFLARLRLREAVVPRVHEELTTRRLLVMERLWGEPLSADLSRSQNPNVRAAIAKAMNVWVSSVTHCEFFHADVHAGNLLLLGDGRVGFIDFGIVGTIEPHKWQAALSLVTALKRMDGLGLARSLVQVGATNADVRIGALADDLNGYLRAFVDATRGGGAADQSPDRLLIEVFSAGEKYGLHFPRDLFLLLKQYLYLDRYLQAVSPGLVDVLALSSLSRRLFQ